MTQADLTRICSTIDAAKDRRGAACVNSGPKGPVDLTQQSPPPPISAGPKPRFEASIDAGFDAADDGEQGPDTDGLAAHSDQQEAEIYRLNGVVFELLTENTQLTARIARKEAANEALIQRVFSLEAKLAATMADAQSLQRQADNWRAECVRLSAVLVEKEAQLAQRMAMPVNALRWGR